ncbi:MULTISPECIES: ABC transporter substrate-binding protein [Pseudomonas]|uniref:Putative ABC transporter, periplasmic substrate-binding protein n=2 Tax=Pseudomonas syringae group TaxID=136849 RepID=A0A3M4IR23_PSEVI|nr:MULTISPECIES: ABC transporter substrate-binding protein [Pseudomonas]KTB71506.1 ABC transporter permease [Pseudomonas sp. ICMP 3272]KTC52048.1 ABC transporter permease [Pseudomonas syringae ICMP 19498]RMP07692.1 putative ABC transporter, periplasmic substrate-binding protein [Pseudomonas syringae pv. persicae]RMQ07259.1 putative ABC transporter, periplasmic substrate-binding protein [Pseudomonas viridiflava]RMQ68748.1 putative ABC transporter, periplasmic substrate-binding protein [Pseudomo
MDELIAISSMENAELAEFVAGISEHIGVPVRLSRWSTSELIDRVSNGTAGDWDLLLGTAATALLDPALNSQLLILDALDCSTLPAQAIAADRRWFSPSGFVPAFCFDPEVLAAHGLTPPLSWEALCAPEWAQRIALPDPGRSGAGYLHLSALLEAYGEGAWGMLAQVAQLRPSISGSSTAPIDAVTEGRAYVGVTVSTAATRAAAQHSSLRWCVPDDARRYEFEVFGCRAGSQRAKQAVQALGWMLSPDAAAISRHYGKVVVGGVSIETLATADLKALNAIEASHAKVARCARWHSLFDTKAGL